MSKNILVVGGAGYIGSHACKALFEAGYNPIVFDNLSTGHRDAIKWGEFFEGDMTNMDSLKSCFSKYDISAVMHFAAASLVAESVQDPLKYYRNNVSGAINLLLVMQEFAVNKIIFSSTAAVYGEKHTKPISETDTKSPINPYGKSKLMIEDILDDVSSAYGIRSIRFRYFNAAGADSSAEIGERHNPETHLIPLVLKAALKKRDNISVFGTDYPTDDGSAVRDYIHVTDLIAAHLLGLQHLLQNNEIKTEVFNLGSGVGSSVLQIIATATDIVDQEIPTLYGNRREGDPAILVASPNKAKLELNWQTSEYSSLENIIKTALKFEEK